MKLSELNIIYEDDILIVCNKPHGLMVEPDRNNFPNLQKQVKDYLKEKTGEKLPYAQHLHRIDRAVSGVVLFTKKKEHLKDLSEQFAQRKVEKYYLALTTKAPAGFDPSVEAKEFTKLEQWHRKEKKKAVLVPEGTEFAEQIRLDYKIRPHGKYFLWQIKLHTGKYHQIRAQLAGLACPVIGDAIYGSKRAYKLNAIALHAHKLYIKHPETGAKTEFTANSDEFLRSVSIKV